MDLRKLLIFLCLMAGWLPAASAALPVTAYQEVEKDPLGVWRQKPRDYQAAVDRGVRVVYLPEEATFFTYWIPPNYRSGRIVVSVHGTGGNPYIAMRDELDDAEKFDYLPIAVSWYSKERGFFPAQDLYRNILQALGFIQGRTGNDLSKVAYIGFSRGSAVSYEVAYLDAHSENIFDFFISHSGGVPLDLRVEARDPDSKPDVFFSRLVNGQLGKDAFKGKKFYLYSGDQDEQWGATMSRQVGYAKELIEAGSGEVLEWVRQASGGHMGFLRNHSLKEKALGYFISLTGQNA